MVELDIVWEHKWRFCLDLARDLLNWILDFWAGVRSDREESSGGGEEESGVVVFKRLDERWK